MNRYIFLASKSDHMVAAYSDLFDVENAIYQADYLSHPTAFCNFLHHLHCCSRTSQQLHFPFRSLWFKQYCSEMCANNTQYIFIFFFNWYFAFENGYISYLRAHYPGCKCVLFLQDIDNAKKLNIVRLKETFDHIMLFEKNYAKECGVDYHPLVYSSRKIGPLSTRRSIDLLFVGQDKGRYDLLVQIYTRLAAEGINCQFYISNTSKTDTELFPGIHIRKFICYDENIRLLRDAKCILDIVPANTNCNTLRMCEAIAYEVKVLTNNTYILEEEYYTPEFISLYTNPIDIDINFLKQPYTKFDYGYKNQMSPIALIQYLNTVLRI